MSNVSHSSGTWIEPEEYCYPNGGFHRRARVVVRQNPHNPISLPYGEYRIVRAGIPDTFFSIPARLRIKGKTVKGFLSHDSSDGELMFTPEADPENCTECPSGDGCRFSCQ